jgi:hypothetical protein
VSCRRDRVDPARQADRERAELAEREHGQHDDDGAEEVRVAEQLAPGLVAEQDDQAERGEAGDQSKAEHRPERDALRTVVLRDFVEPHGLQREDRQHAGHGVEDDADEEREAERERIRVDAEGELGSEEIDVGAGRGCPDEDGRIEAFEQLGLVGHDRFTGRDDLRVDAPRSGLRREAGLVVTDLVNERAF